MVTATTPDPRRWGCCFKQSRQELCLLNMREHLSSVLPFSVAWEWGIYHSHYPVNSQPISRSLSLYLSPRWCVVIRVTQSAVGLLLSCISPYADKYLLSIVLNFLRITSDEKNNALKAVCVVEGWEGGRGIWQPLITKAFPPCFCSLGTSCSGAAFLKHTSKLSLCTGHQREHADSLFSHRYPSLLLLKCVFGLVQTDCSCY